MPETLLDPEQRARLAALRQRVASGALDDDRAPAMGADHDASWWLRSRRVARLATLRPSGEVRAGHVEVWRTPDGRYAVAVASRHSPLAEGLASLTAALAAAESARRLV